MFVSMADAASIVLCDDGWWLPVAMEGDYLALQQAYRRVVQKPGQPLLVSFEGTIATRPSLEESRPPRQTVLVDRLLAVHPGESCSPSIAPAPFPNTYWKLASPRSANDAPLRSTRWNLVLLESEPVDAAGLRNPPYLIFAADAPRLSGSGGCHPLRGSFHVEDDRLYLGQIETARMDRPDVIDLELAFLEALAWVGRYRIQGNRLDLLDEAGNVVASFKADARR